MRVQLTFRSGAQVEFDADKVTSNDSFGGDIKQFQWETPADWKRKLHNLDLSEVVAIVAIREPEAGQS